MADVPGAWVVYAYDGPAYPIALFDNEDDALRHSNDLGYGWTKFWPFTSTWDEIMRG